MMYFSSMYYNWRVIEGGGSRRTAWMYFLICIIIEGDFKAGAVRTAWTCFSIFQCVSLIQGQLKD